MAGVSPEDYDAIGDGNSHPLSERFATLAAAQAQYPHATALTDEIDWAAWQGCLDQFGRLSTGERYTPAVVRGGPGKHYVTNKSIRIRQSFIKADGQFCLLRSTNATQPVLQVDHDDIQSSAIAPRIERFYTSGGGGSIYAYSAPEIEIEHVYVKDHAHSTQGQWGSGLGYGTQGHGIMLAGCVSARVRHCGLDKTGGLGIYIKAYLKQGQGQSVIAESQDTIVEGNRISYCASVGILFSEGGGHIARENTVQLAASSAVIFRSTYCFEATGNYTENNGGYDIVYEYLPEYLAQRNSTGGLIEGNRLESQYNILLASGDDTHVIANRLSGASVISANAQRTRWGVQLDQGSLSNSSGTTVFA